MTNKKHSGTPAQMSINDAFTVPNTIRKILIDSMTIAAVAVSLLTLAVHVFHIVDLERYFIQDIIDLIQILIAWNLLRRKRLAWGIYVCSISLELILFILFGRPTDFVDIIGSVNLLGIIVNIYALLILLICHNSFKRKSMRLLSREAIIPGTVAVFIFAFVSYKTKGFSTAIDIFLMQGPDNTRFEDFAALTLWVCVGIFIYMVLRPAIVTGMKSKAQREYARSLIKEYGVNPSSYLILEDDKLLYFGRDVEGVVGYGVVGGVIVVLGDPICAERDFIKLLAEFNAFCVADDYQCIFLGVTEKYVELYKMFGYTCVKCGEEPRFELDQYQLTGGKMAKMRMNINHATKAGLKTYEYKPLEKRDLRIEREIKAVSDSWLQGKNGGQLKFTLGSVGLENPMDRRYFYAKKDDGKVMAFNVYTPFLGTDGYMADITRRSRDCPGGATEKIMYDAFMTFKEEGYTWGSMGLAPLANVRGDGVKDALIIKILDLIYRKFNLFYGFKDLHRAKMKYKPTEWVAGYFAFTGKMLTPQMAYALIKVQSTAGVKEFFETVLGVLAEKRRDRKIAREKKTA